MLEEGAEGGFGKLGERVDTTAGAGDGDVARGNLEGFLDEMRGHANVRDFAVLGIAGEGGGRRWEESDVEDDFVKGGVGAVAVGFPVGGFEVELQGTVAFFSIDLDGGAIAFDRAVVVSVALLSPAFLEMWVGEFGFELDEGGIRFDRGGQVTFLIIG